MNRFVVFQLDGEWLVSHGDRTRLAFSTRKDAERSAFDAADALAASGHAVSVLIMPDGPDADGQHFALISGQLPRGARN